MRKDQTKKKEEILASLYTLGRKTSDATILFHELVARKAGLAGADHKYLNILLEHGPMTAGELADLSGLTTGAVTGVIDRLEKVGLVRREKDAHDRRKVVVVPDEQIADELLGPLFARLTERLSAMFAGFSEEELAVIMIYMEKGQALMRELIEEMKKGD